jgi:sporulation protein YlmC with PRC-barrel domain
MSRHALGPMILAASILAVPALAAQSDEAPNNAPAMTSTPSSHSSANMTSPQPVQTAPVSNSAASTSATPTYTTADGHMRLGKIVGASIYNDQDQSVGSVDDVLMSHDNEATSAVISVGGFLGMGSKLVSVPFDQLKVENNRIVMPGATKASLSSMPDYKYNNA